MSIDKIQMGLGAIKPIEKPSGVGPIGAPKSEQGGNGFGDMLTDALKEVDTLQKSADKQIKGLMLHEEGVTPHGAMIALEKADIAFQLMTQVRAKIVRAYEEVMRTQV